MNNPCIEAIPAAPVCAIVVTHNRLDLLRAAVSALRAQTCPLRAILIVDNGSTDGTARWIAEAIEKDQRGQLRVLTQANGGSAGGFASGLTEAMGSGEWLWCMDDDTVPEPDCLERMLAAAGRFRAAKPGARLGWMNSVIRWSDGALHRMNEPGLAPFLEWPANVAASRYLPARWCSYVSLLVASEAVAEAGLPLREMFIWYDDVEFTARISQRGFQGLVALDSFAEHRTQRNYAPDVEDLDETNIARFRHAFRNEVVFLRTICDGRRGAFAARFARLMLRRIRLMAAAGKWRYLPEAIAQGCRGLAFPRAVEFPRRNATIEPPKTAFPKRAPLAAASVFRSPS